MHNNVLLEDLKNSHERYSGSDFPNFIRRIGVRSPTESNAIALATSSADELTVRALAEFISCGLDQEPLVFPDIQGSSAIRSLLIFITGSVASGKSIFSEMLRKSLSNILPSKVVQVICTDGFLFSNIDLTQKNLLNRKGFPESYNVERMRNFITAMKRGEDEVVRAPIYSHEEYDLVTGAFIELVKPDITIVEGLFPPDIFFDFCLRSNKNAGVLSIYLDAEDLALENWYVARFERLRQDAIVRSSIPDKYVLTLGQKSEEVALRYWREINQVNLRSNIKPIMRFCDLVIRKSPDHSVDAIFVKKDLVRSCLA